MGGWVCVAAGEGDRSPEGVCGAEVEMWTAVAGSPTARPASAKVPRESAIASTMPAIPKPAIPSARLTLEA